LILNRRPVQGCWWWSWL